ncbi:MAG: type II toxin-antitoxin system RelE/ParE family toxin [Cyclobacteriaceae bacterium]|nr:type II toxin-antitoxin system RelE/ParE family toxin [Cyclobacteriaceae bacterium]
MKIIWSEDALLDYHQNIDYLLRDWSESVALQFVEEVEGVIELIQINPELYPLTDYRDIRKALIQKQITLFYKIADDNVFLIRFWNNYQDPSRLKL